MLSSKIHPSNLFLTRNSPQNQISTIPKTLSLSLITPNKLKPKSIKISPLPSFSSKTLEESISDDKHGAINRGKKKRGTVVKPLERRRLVLKFVWLERHLGIALDLVIPGGNGTIPVSLYYFWPSDNGKDTWEELTAMFESKQWIPMRERILLLNQASVMINLWQSTHVEI